MLLNFTFLCRLCPIFQVSNVSGENLDLLKMFLNLLTTRNNARDDEPAEFQIDDMYSVPVSDIHLIFGHFLSLNYL
jgi:GTPase